MSLDLSQSVTFEPVSKVTHVFFDDLNGQIFSVRSGGATGIMTRGFNSDKNNTFRLEHDQGPITTIKLNPDQTLLALQRGSNENQVEFFEVDEQKQLKSSDVLSQACKTKNAQLLGFSWLSQTEIAFFTDHSIELYQVLTSRKLVKSVRISALQHAWYTFCPKSSLAICLANPQHLQPVSIKNSYIQKLSKIELDNVPTDKDVGICSLYNSSFVYVITPGQLNLYKVNLDATQLNLYRVNLDEPNSILKAYQLSLPQPGAICVNVVDQCLVLHHQKSATSYVYDINSGGEKPMFNAKINQVKTNSYSTNWVTFQPDILVDAKNGVMWKLKLILNDQLAAKFDENLCELVKFLQNREGGKIPLLDVLLKLISNAELTDLSQVGGAFDLLNQAYRKHLNRNNSKLLVPKVILDQADLFTNLFTPMNDNARLDSILLEYYRSLGEHQIQPQHFLNELLIRTLVKSGKWFQLHQLLNYRVISDSKPLACLLLSLENSYKPSTQLALDMLHRLKNNSKEEICEILLDKGKVLPATNFALRNNLDSIPTKKFLEAALRFDGGSDKTVFRMVYSAFKKRNLFPKSNSHAEYAKYHEIFNNST